MSWFSKLFGGNKAAEKPVAPAPLPEPIRMSLDERMELRREMAFKTVREIMIANGFLSTGYKVNITRTDTRGHIYAVMLDVGSAAEAGRGIQSQEEMLRLENQILEAARTRYRIKISSVFWRVTQLTPAPASVAPPRRAQPPAPPTSVDTNAMPSDFISAPSPMPAFRPATAAAAVGMGVGAAAATRAAAPAPTMTASVSSVDSDNNSLLGNLFNTKPSIRQDGFPDTQMDEKTVRMERVTEDEMEAFAQALTAAHAKAPVHVGSRTYQTDYAPLE